MAATSDRLHARIVYYGPAQAGLSSNLAFIERKLRREHRGELRRVSAGAAQYEELPVELGKVKDTLVSLEISTVPTGEDAAELRRQLLRGASGVVFVADLRPTRHEATRASLAELRAHLESLGDAAAPRPFVVQYNRRDMVDENALDALHRGLDLDAAATFEAVAHEGTGVLQTLTTVAKLLLQRPRSAASAAVVEPFALDVTAEDSQEFSGPLVEARPARLADEPTKLRLCDAGPVEAVGGELRIPLRLVDEASGREIPLHLRLTLDAQ